LNTHRHTTTVIARAEASRTCGTAHQKKSIADNRNRRLHIKIFYNVRSCFVF